MILAIETSSPQGSVAVWDPEHEALVFQQTFTSDRAHNAMIFEPLRAALQTAEVRPQLIVVGTGPGSYSGIRVGIAVANGLSIAYHAKAIGLSSLLALPAEENDYLVAGDARRNSYFIAEVVRRALQGEPKMMEAPEFQVALDEATQQGKVIYTTDPAPPLDRTEIHKAIPCAVALAKQAALLSEAELTELAARPIEPMYLRGAFITMPKRRSTTVQDPPSS